MLQTSVRVSCLGYEFPRSAPFPSLRVHDTGASLLGLAVFDDGGSDSVHISDALLGEGLANDDLNIVVADVLGGANVAGGLELLEAVADVLTSGLGEVLGAGAHALVATVVLAEGVDTALLAHVELVGDGGGTDVQPVVIVGGELPSAGSLGVLGPLYIIINIPLKVKETRADGPLARWSGQNEYLHRGS
jgi:hypothetical protein